MDGRNNASKAWMYAAKAWMSTIHDQDNGQRPLITGVGAHILAGLLGVVKVRNADRLQPKGCKDFRKLFMLRGRLFGPPSSWYWIPKATTRGAVSATTRLPQSPGSWRVVPS